MHDEAPFSPATFTRRYTAALTLLAVLAVGKFAWFELLGIGDGRAEALVNTAGRQRMLTQRVAFEGLRLSYAETPAEAAAARRRLADALERLEEQHTALVTSARDATDWRGEEAALAHLYFDEGLDARMVQFLDSAHELADLPAEAVDASTPALLRLQAEASPDLFDGLERAVSLYEQGAQDLRWTAHLVNIGSFLGVLGTLGVLAFRVFGPMARAMRTETERLRQAQREQEEAARRSTFLTQLRTAFDMVHTEDEVSTLVAITLRDHGPSDVSLLLTDADQSALAPVFSEDGVPRQGCGVEAPLRCAAIRRGHPLRFASSEQLDACPRLRDEPRARSALCIPLSFMGGPLGVLHVPGVVGGAEDGAHRERLEITAALAADRLGTVRTLESIERQAATDPLTGLLNRRAMDAAVRQLTLTRTPYAVIMADLDYFKRLNDAHGHEAGDRALRLFAQVLRGSIRAEDAASRHGGEEFVIVLPHATLRVAMATAERLREQLQVALLEADLPRFTASFGVAASREGATFPDTLHAADLALLSAKKNGRDQVVGAGEPMGGALVEVPQVSA